MKMREEKTAQSKISLDSEESHVQQHLFMRPIVRKMEMRSHLASICLTVPVIWFIFSSKREMVSLFCLELASKLCRGNVRMFVTKRCRYPFEHPLLKSTTIFLGVRQNCSNSLTCDLWSSCWLMVRRSSSCCRSSIRASCFSHMSFSSIFIDISISCFIPICTSSSFSTSCSG